MDLVLLVDQVADIPDCIRIGLIIRLPAVPGPQFVHIEDRVRSHGQFLCLTGIQAQSLHQSRENLSAAERTLNQVEGIRAEAQRIDGIAVCFNRLLSCTAVAGRKGDSHQEQADKGEKYNGVTMIHSKFG